MKYLGKGEEVISKTIKREIEYMRCDKCHKKILPGDYDNEKSQYILIHSWHNDWGNDNIESHEYSHYCRDCAKDVVSEYISNNHSNIELEISKEYLPKGKVKAYYSTDDGYELAENDNYTTQNDKE